MHVFLNRRPIIIIGKMGSGKSSVLTELFSTYSTKNLKYERIITYTTRSKRIGESKEEYHFIDDGTFDRMVQNGDFAEYYTTEKNGHPIKYGSALEDYQIENRTIPGNIETIKTIILTPGGLKNILHVLGIDNCTVIYLRCKDETLRSRLAKRNTESEDEINARLKTEESDFNKIEQYTNLTIDCDNLTVSQIANMIDRYVHCNLSEF